MSGKIRNPARRCKICGGKCNKQMRYCKLCAADLRDVRRRVGEMMPVVNVGMD